MELRQLEYFVALAEDRHFTQAANRLHLAQSGLSASILSLEREMGLPLFIRNTRHVELTEAGRVFLVEARRTLAAARAARESLSAIQGLTRGILRIGALHRPPESFDLAALIGRFHADYPGVVVRIQQATSGRLLAALRDGSLDIAFTGLTGTPPAGLSVASLAPISISFACRHDHHLACRPEVALSELAGEKFIDLESWTSLRRFVDRAFAAAHVERYVAFEVSDLDLLARLVRHGLGVALMADYIELNPDGRLRFVPLRPRLEAEFVVAALGNPPSSPAARVLFSMATAGQAASQVAP